MPRSGGRRPLALPRSRPGTRFRQEQAGPLPMSAIPSSGSRGTRSGSPAGSRTTARWSRLAAARRSARCSARRPAADRRAEAAHASFLVGHSYLGAVARGLLEVVAEDFVVARRDRPVRSSHEANRSWSSARDRLRQRVVRGVPDQQMAEPEGVLVGEHRGSAGRAPSGRAPGGASLHAPSGASGDKRPTRAPRERPSHRPTRARRHHCALVASKAVEPRREQRLDRRRHRRPRERSPRRDPGSVLRWSTALVDEHLRASPRRTAGCPRRPAIRVAAAPAARPVPDQPASFSARERLEHHRVAFGFPPPQPGRRSRSSGLARHSSRSGRRAPVGQVLDEIEERRLAPVHVVEDDDHRPLASASLSRSLRTA